MRPPTRRELLGGGGALGLAWIVGQLWGHRPLGTGPAERGAAEGAADSPFLGASARGTLVAAFEALLPEGAPAEEVAADVDRFLAGSDPALGGQLVLALGALEHLGGFGPGSFRRFSRLERAERVALLERWRTSALGPKRQIADAVRRVALFAWYTRADTWSRIGYDGPWVPTG